MDTERASFSAGDEAPPPPVDPNEPVDSSYFDTPPPPAPWPTPTPSASQGAGCGLHLARIVLGAFIAFVVMSLLYGPNMAVAAIGFAVICTAGVSLILIIPGCWLVGWVAMAVWDVVNRELAKPKAPGAP